MELKNGTTYQVIINKPFYCYGKSPVDSHNFSTLFFDNIFDFTINNHEPLYDASTISHIILTCYYNLTGTGFRYMIIRVYIRDSSSYYTYKSNEDIVEFKGDLLTQSSTNYTDFYELAKLHDFPYIYPVTEIQFYILSGKTNVVNKTGNLSESTNLYGAFKDEINVLNPILFVEFDSFPRYNYIYIPNLSRYYFINEIVCVRDKLYRIHCHVDVLFTYSTDIYAQENVFVVRSADYEYQETYDNICSTADDRVNFESYYYSVYDDNTNTGSLINTSFNASPSGNKTFVACVINDRTQLSPENIPSEISGTPEISTSRFSNPLTFNYLLYYEQVLELINAVKDSSSRQSKVINILSLPFDVADIETPVMLTNSNIRIGSEDIGPLYLVGLHAIKNDFSNYIVIADFTPSKTYSGYINWMNYEPYMYHELFLPYYGWIQVNGKDIVGKRIVVYYAVNYQTGGAQVYVQNQTDGKLIFMGTCQLGMNIPISVSNAEENNVARMNNGTNLALGLIGSAVATGIGVATLNPVAIAGGILSAGHSLASAVTGENAIFERVNGQASSGNSGLYTSQKVIYKKSIKAVHNFSTPMDDSFVTLNGYKINDYLNLGQCGGHTEIGLMEYQIIDQTQILKPEIEEIETLARDGIIL